MAIEPVVAYNSMKPGGGAGKNGRVSWSRIGRSISKMVIRAYHSVLDDALESVVTKGIPITVEVIHAHLVDGDSNHKFWTGT